MVNLHSMMPRPRPHDKGEDLSKKPNDGIIESTEIKSTEGVRKTELNVA